MRRTDTGGGDYHLTERTCQLHWMLYRAQTIQLVCFFTLMILPVLLMQPLKHHFITTSWSSAELNIAMQSITSVHALADYATILYFIRPYRDYTITRLRSMKDWLLDRLDRIRGAENRVSDAETLVQPNAVQIMSGGGSGVGPTVAEPTASSGSLGVPVVSVRSHFYTTVVQRSGGGVSARNSLVPSSQHDLPAVDAC
jgi:Serpentine type 7TM GPCR chemoreceptor Srh